MLSSDSDRSRLTFHMAIIVYAYINVCLMYYVALHFCLMRINYIYITCFTIIDFM
jgi:hypothetical protein